MVARGCAAWVKRAGDLGIAGSRPAGNATREIAFMSRQRVATAKRAGEFAPRGPQTRDDAAQWLGKTP